MVRTASVCILLPLNYFFSTCCHFSSSPPRPPGNCRGLNLLLSSSWIFPFTLALVSPFELIFLLLSFWLIALEFPLDHGYVQAMVTSNISSSVCPDICLLKWCLLLIKKWFTWFLGLSSEEFQVSLWISLWAKIVLPMYILDTPHSSVSLSLFWFWTLIPRWPRTLPVPHWSLTTLALWELITINKALCWSGLTA